jgi:DNA-binding transcriptional MerR regulator
MGVVEVLDMYTIKEIADLAGVTTRTLRYYDQLGLLTPAKIGENDYRYYDHDNLLKLQQVLFFRELDLPLKEILFILNRPDFSLQSALKNHRRSLQKKVDRISTLLETIDNTILSLEGEDRMPEKEYFTGFDESKYEEEARDLWGDTPQYTDSQQKWSSYTEDQKEEIKREGERIIRRMVTDKSDAAPDDPGVQEAVAEYHAYFNKYFYTSGVEVLRGLAEMWVDDPRFAVNYERIREGGAAFVREAVQIYCDRQMGGKG